MNDEEALKVAQGIVERVMAKTPPGRPAFYAFGHAQREIEKAAHDVRVRGAALETRISTGCTPERMARRRDGIYRPLIQRWTQTVAFMLASDGATVRFNCSKCGFGKDADLDRKATDLLADILEHYLSSVAHTPVH